MMARVVWGLKVDTLLFHFICLKVYNCTPSGVCDMWINFVVVSTGSSSGGGARSSSSSSSYSYFAVVLIIHTLFLYLWEWQKVRWTEAVAEDEETNT